MEHWRGEVCQPTSRGIQLAGYSGASAGQRGASGWVRLCGHGSQRLLRPAPTQHPPVQTSPVVTSACLWTLWGSSGCCKPFCTKVAHLVPKQDYSWAVRGAAPPPLSLGQGYLARKEVVLSSLVHSNQDLALRNQSPSFSQPWEDLAVGLGVWQEVGCAHASWTWRAEALEAASGNGRGEPGKPGDCPNQGCNCLGDSKDSSCWHPLFSAASP